jgi:transglutaminase 1
LVTGDTLRITLTAKEYIDKLVDKSLIKVYAIANVKETRQTWSEEDDFQLQKPKLNIQVLEINSKIENSDELLSSPNIITGERGLVLCVDKMRN